MTAILQATYTRKYWIDILSGLPGDVGLALFKHELSQLLTMSTAN